MHSQLCLHVKDINLKAATSLIVTSLFPGTSAYWDVSASNPALNSAIIMLTLGCLYGGFDINSNCMPFKDSLIHNYKEQGGHQ